MAGNGISEGCPSQVVYDVATQMIDELERDGKLDHTQAQRQRGLIAVNTAALEKVADKVNCPGAHINENGLLTCPLLDMVSGIRSLSIGSTDARNYALALENIVDDTPNTNTGTYL